MSYGFHGDEQMIEADQAEILRDWNDAQADDAADAEPADHRCPDCKTTQGISETKDILNLPALRCRCGCEWWNWSKSA